MIHRVLRIGWWVVDFLFAETRYDDDAVFGCLYDCHAPESVLERSSRIMSSGRYNRGFTYGNTEHRRAVVVIGPTTSGRQFQNTFVHEIRHLADIIAGSLGIELDSEPPAYLSGDTAMALADVVCRMGCDNCR